MTEKEKNEAAAAPAKPITIGGQVYLISPVTLSQMAAMGHFIQKRLQRSSPVSLLVNDPAFKLLPAQAQVEAAKEAARLQITGTKTLDGEALMDGMREPEALAFFAWLLARGNHPGLRLEEVSPHITPDNAGVLFLDLIEASGMLLLGEPGGPVG
jgi:hypothetical protein